jgi:hypothetical protein
MPTMATIPSRTFPDGRKMNRKPTLIKEGERPSVEDGRWMNFGPLDGISVHLVGDERVNYVIVDLNT